MNNKVLLLVVCILICVMCGCQHTSPSVTEPTDATVTEPAEQINPLLAESELWNEKFTEEDAAKAFADMPAPDTTSPLKSSSVYRLCRVIGDNWMIKNAEGEELICRDGVLWGSMSYYEPMTYTGEEKTNGHLYESGWFYIKHSDKYEYIPGETDAGIQLIDSRQTARKTPDIPNYAYSETDKALVELSDYYNQPLVGHEVMIAPYSLQNKGAVSLQSGTGVERVYIGEDTITVCGSEARFEDIIVRSVTVPRVEFVA